MLTRLLTRLKRPGKSRAQGLVEFALILPVLLMAIFVIIELARVLHAWLAVENGARFGVRYAVTGEWNDDYCAIPDNCVDEDDEDQARVPSTVDAARAGAVAILRNDAVTDIDQPGFFKVTVCSAKDPSLPQKYEYEAGSPNGPTESNCYPLPHPLPPLPKLEEHHAGDPGDTVIVSIDFTHPLITPMISSVWPDLHIRAQRTGIVEQYRTSRVFGLPIVAFTTPPTSTPSPTPSDTPTPTLTPSPTPSLTPTPTPSCDNIILERVQTTSDNFEFRLRNNNVASAFLLSTYLEWEKLDGDMYFNYFEWNDSIEYYDTHHSSSPVGPISTSPWGSALGIEFVGGGNRDDWEADFNRNPRPLYGEHYARLTFGFNDIPLTCVIEGSVDEPVVPTNTPRPTRTPCVGCTATPTRTPRPPTATKTDGPPPTNTTAPSDTPAVTSTKDWGDG